ncbi:carbon-nitrogen hydrolase family protein [Streptomyces paromomycinus]|uniref:Putative carbon-nitrogen hydrolase family protein n=1 Tax=Streptomyces paromomycinus TaxID=92743 RepID=A0A401W9T3_STREY|nr:carbon-nitrogen hydrolase family protein [Streptomyces paromomycinus]GCD46050.1 putative carbon-nitrogen hydrolase family protein [Streptomyces paromomycinus]
MIVATAQFPPAPLDIAANAARMATLLAEAAGRGAELVVFAELTLTNYELDAIAAAPEEYTLAPDDARLAPVRDACRTAGVAAVVNCPGVGPAGTADGMTISSFVYGPDGALLTRYDKHHLHGRENGLFTAGPEAGGRFTFRGLKFALATCYDNAFPEVAERAAADGCQVYLASSFHDEVERTEQYAAKARDHGIDVLLANGVGPGSDGVACGYSGIWAADGTCLARLADGAGAAVAEVGRAAGRAAAGPEGVREPVGNR